MSTSSQTGAAGWKPVSSSSQADASSKKPVSSSSGADAHSSGRALTEMERAVLWEIKKGQGYVSSFQKLRDAHSLILSLIATVNLVAFLQPPKGWHQMDGGDDTQHQQLNAVSVMYNTGSIEAFAIANSLSLYCAIAGLLFFLYCSNAGVLAMAASKMPANPNSADNYTELGIRVLHRVRACLRCVVLPSLRRRLNILSTFVACSLSFSLMAFIASGFAAASPQERLFFVIVPAIPGCILVIFFLVMALAKHRTELDFDTQINKYWEHIVCVGKDCAPPIETLTKKENLHRKNTSIMDVDRIPLLTCFFPSKTESSQACKDHHEHGNPEILRISAP